MRLICQQLGAIISQCFEDHQSINICGGQERSTEQDPALLLATKAATIGPAIIIVITTDTFQDQSLGQTPENNKHLHKRATVTSMGEKSSIYSLSFNFEFDIVQEKKR